MDESTITYAIVNGYITGTQLSGDKDSVVTKSYTFTPGMLLPVCLLWRLYFQSIRVIMALVQIPLMYHSTHH